MELEHKKKKLSKKDFLIIVSDALRWSIRNGKTDFGVNLYFGKDAQKFHRPDGTIKPVHCGWISTIQDDWKENKLFKGED